MLTQRQIDFYRASGYIGVEGVLSEQDILDLRRVTDEFVEKSRQAAQNTDVFDLEPGHTPETPRLRRLKNPADQHPIYNRMLRLDPILDIVAQLIGPGIRYNGHKLNMKSPEFGSPVEWHQDWAFYPHTNDDLLAVGIAMDDMLIENGCLMVIPGSHRGPVYDHHQKGKFVGAVTDPRFNPKEAVPVELRAGGISIHHVRAMHGSAPNVSSRPRRLLLNMYCAVDAWPLSGVKDWDQFNSYILRGEPTNVPRVEKVPVRMPLPQADRTGSIYEVQSVLEKPFFGRKAG
ncbi:MAG: phytanoyl-CoA dioxygenase [Candidatus Handelsmanbacteria bacterium RIFCSPLOWO2_12_FULL_64_10]|uniref:Phytanoyl-CoA dioxygenase n=1 Tax=Handelsmanbacteria sp. (strain RIFCSPLOWO2_12_FULL_64_10) TaxID=1817868 RepID=A0A1F6CD12_HANXR|nr:MAG: phytanoyl-CoA dioxygenase [Candidatus Handelsmanbacteria bacterium RIFCSPLOWO2_12_FULL_64_10]